MADNGRVRRTTTEGPTLRTPLIRVLITLTTALALASCSGEDTPAADQTPAASGTTSPSTEATPTEDAKTDGTVIEITIDGDTVDPNGDRVEVPLGEPVTFDITADRDGELHVHSTPEEELAFSRGDTEAELTFDKPGVVDVEDHESGKVIVQLQVS
jgi:hypothetical protein